MTQEEKARAYDEAIRKAQDISHTSEFIKITDLFPQLSESEDEKIREFLIGILSQGTWRKEWPFSPNEVVAYLERQNHVQSDTEKEYVRTLKSLIFNFLSGKDEVDRDYYQRIEDWLDGRHIEQKEQKSTNVLEDAFKYYTDRGITISCGDFKAEPKKEQKPEYTVFVGGSEVNDELLIKDEAEILAKKYKEDGYDDVVIERIEHQPAECLKAERDGWYVCIKDYYRGGKKCSSAGDLVLAKGGMHIMGEKDISEWFRRAYYEEVREVFRPNEEDVYITNILERIVGKNRPDEIFKIGNKQGVSAYKICSWLKSLPERLNLQPAEWSEEDEQRIAEIEFAVMQMNTKRVDTKDKCLTWLKSLRPQSKQEWSEEDERILKGIIGLIDHDQHYGVSNNEMISWLKTLRPQLKQKWSEEDKKMLWIIQLALTKHPITDKQEKDAFDWLNSLRPQPHTVSIKNATKFGNLEYERGVKDGIQSEKSRQWKPSEEQMDALRASNSYWKGTTNEVPRTDLLESLYNDLEKLIAKR